MTRLHPPPRPPADERDERSRKRASAIRTVFFSALFGTLAAALFAVFVVLPRSTQDRTRPPVSRMKQTPFPTRVANPELPRTATPAAPSEEVRKRPAPRAAAAENRPTPTPRDDHEFMTAMSRGLAAVEEEQWHVAREAFEQASRLKPGAPEVADGLARTTAGERRSLVKAGISRGLELEASENWAEAERAYSAVLQTDPEAAAALAGQERAARRADLDERLEHYLNEPGRLTTPSVFEDASGLVDDARQITHRGPRLEAQVVRLEQFLERAATPVPVILESDGATEVTLYRVGRLGVFARRELSLRPGAYTAVGSRDGYRDVRVVFQVEANGTPETVIVSCSESL